MHRETVAEWIARGNTPRRVEPLRLTFDDFLRIIDTIPQKRRRPLRPRGVRATATSSSRRD